jgi:YebC/PmpR family DNA-binding regulatory protein
MSGHSKWHNIKTKKNATDAARGKIFTKVLREITTAVRQGGPSPDSNVRLRVAVDKARENNVPSDTLKRAIQKGTGELPGHIFEEITYEGYGPKGVAVMVEVSTDNRNRTSANIRHLFSSHGGNLGENGCVNWLFQNKGIVLLAKEKGKEDDYMMAAIDAGAEDFREEMDYYEVTVEPEALLKVKQALTAAGAKIQSADITMVPNTFVTLTGDDARKVLSLTDELEEQDEVIHVFSNFDISDEELQRLSG